MNTNIKDTYGPQKPTVIRKQKPWIIGVKNLIYFLPRRYVHGHNICDEMSFLFLV